MAGAHFFCQLGLRKRAGKDDVFAGESGEKVANVVLDCADDGEIFLRMLEAGEGLEEVGDSFAEADVASEENFEGVLRWFASAGEVVEADAVGDDVDFLWRDAHLHEGSFCDRGWDGDGIRCGVDLFFADGDVWFAERLRDVPATVLVGDDVFLKALVGRATIADEDAAAGLNFASGEQARAGDADEGVAGRDDAVSPAIEGEGVPGVHLRGECGRIEARMIEQVVRCVNEGKGADERVGKAFALQAGPGPGGIDLLKMPFAVQLVCQFKVVIDTKDGLGNFHRGATLLSHASRRGAWM